VIIQELEDVSRRTILSLTMVDRHLHGIATPTLYRHAFLTTSVDQHRTSLLCQTLDNNLSLGRHVRSFTDISLDVISLPTAVAQALDEVTYAEFEGLSSSAAVASLAWYKLRGLRFRVYPTWVKDNSAISTWIARQEELTYMSLPIDLSSDILMDHLPKLEIFHGSFGTACFLANWQSLKILTIRGTRERKDHMLVIDRLTTGLVEIDLCLDSANLPGGLHSIQRKCPSLERLNIWIFDSSGTSLEVCISRRLIDVD
jgi:hypothetical protein